ncbi:Tigger transposable element-derived protein 4 [Araneus ventricosus]|uniref:Tigger transposable element-derived protein 4 n=1 Tax=Araneus ventricosus TaxID=182803 RepID=A0A4Y2ME70_ARAVE|nr:Tigger transposable element-derived protein 4 [Araneus ventricosus]
MVSFGCSLCQDVRSRNLPIKGPILQAKANEFAERFEEKSFVCSNGWLDRFKKRHNIRSGKVVGESASVCSSDMNHWMESVIIPIYDEKDICNSDETGLFYKLTPNQTLKFKGEKCVGDKLSKVRITILVCASMNGSEEQKLTVIGKSQKSRCFKNVKKLPLDYNSNKKAWMTSDLFQKYLRQWDNELAKKKRKIVLLINNCTAHIEPSNLQWVNVVFLPPNSTSVFQKMDEGVIRSLKCHYRKQSSYAFWNTMIKTRTVTFIFLMLLFYSKNRRDWQQNRLSEIVLVTLGSRKRSRQKMTTFPSPNR